MHLVSTTSSAVARTIPRLYAWEMIFKTRRFIQLPISSPPLIPTGRVRTMTTRKTSHLERTAAEPRARELYDVKLVQIDQVNERVRLFRLRPLSVTAKFLPGQWLDTFVPGTTKAGGFTITSPPSAALTGHPTPYLELAVQESPENPAAAWLWRPREDILGAILQVRIGGSFVLPPPEVDVHRIRRLVLVAGGVGVNPLMSMLSHVGERAEEELGGLEVRMAYGSKVPRGGPGKMLFLDRITELFGEGKVKGSLSLFATGSGEELVKSGRQCMNGADVEIRGRRLADTDLKELVGTEKDSTLVYICGPQTMTDEVAATLTSKDGLAMDPKYVLTEKWW